MPHTSTLTEVGLNKLNDMFVNGKLLGVNEGQPVNNASNNYFTWLPLVVRDSTHYKFSSVVFTEGIMTCIQVNIERQTGVVELIEKILTTNA